MAISLGNLVWAQRAIQVAAAPVHHGQYNSSVVYGGELHVFELQSSNSYLEHDWWDGSSWHSETLDGAGGSNGQTTDHVGSNNSAVVYNGQLHDFYYDATSHALRHAWWDGTNWHFETLDGAGSPYKGASTDELGEYSSAAIYNGQLQDFYYDFCRSFCLATSVTNTLRHAWWDGTTWHLETLDGTGSPYGGASTDGLGDYNSAVAYNGQLHDFYWDFCNHTCTSSTFTLRHAWWSGTTWHLETLDGTGSPYRGASTDELGDFSSAVVYRGQLQDFYFDSCTAACGPPTNTLRHAWWDGTGWHFETLDGAGSPYLGASTDELGQYSSAVVYNGQLQDFYYDFCPSSGCGSSTNTLRHAWWNGTSWHLETLDGTGSPYSAASTDELGDYSSAVVYNGQLQDFYYDFCTAACASTNDTLKHAWWNGASWGFEFLP